MGSDRGRYTLLVSALLVCLAAVVMGLGPAFLAAGLNRYLAGTYDTHAPVLEVIHPGLTRTRLGPVRIHRQRIAESIRIAYSPGALVRGRIDSLEFNGVQLRMTVDNGGVFLPDLAGMVPEKTAARSSGEKSVKQALDTLFRHGPERVAVTHSMLLLTFRDQTYAAPFEVSATLSRASRILDIGFKVHIRDMIFQGRLSMDGQGRLRSCDLQAPFLNPVRLWDVAGPPRRGGVIRRVEGFHLAGHRQGVYRLKISRLTLGTPIPMVLSDITLTTSEQNIRQLLEKKDEKADAQLQASLTLSGPHVPEPVSLSADIQGNLNGKWEIRIHTDQNKGRNRWPLDGVPGRWALSGPPRVQLTVAGRGPSGRVDVRAAAAGLSGEVRQIAVDCGRFSLSGNGRFHLSGPEPFLDLDMAARMTALKLDRTVLHVSAAAPRITARLVWPGPHSIPALTGLLELENSTLGLQQDLEVTAISGQIPLAWPLEGAAAEQGRLAGRVSHKTGINARLDARTTLSPAGPSISGRLSFLDSTRQPDSAVPVFGQLPTLDFYLQGRYTPSSQGRIDGRVDLPRFVMGRDMLERLGLAEKAARFPDFSADVSGNAAFTMGADGIGGNAELSIVDGQVTFPGGRGKAEGLRTTLVLDHLPWLRSRPGLELAVDRVHLADLAFSNLKARYTLEAPDRLLVEQVDMDWCGGRAGLQSFRWTPETDTYDVTLFCNHLRLDQLLTQLGEFRAVGEGSLNGSIPLTWRRGMLTFDRGFLYSTPGKGGTIRLTGAQALLRGIPEGTPQYHQVDLARTALENYAYDWARIGFNSSGENLVVNLAFDGRPASPLPFRYTPETGGFVRVEGPGSRFQGIQLDVNLNLPLQRVMELGRDVRKYVQ